jgi:hypothetical protein
MIPPLVNMSFWELLMHTDLSIRIAQLEERISSIDSNMHDEVDCFGLDLKVLYVAERSGRYLPFAKAYYRTSQEPMILSHWESCKQLNFDEQSAVEFVSLLTGGRQNIRSKPMVGHAPDGKSFIFASSPSPSWISELQECADQAKTAVELAAALFIKVIFEHPFSDGNGRFSRALIYGALGRFGVVSKPCLGLNGAYELRRDEMSSAFRESCAINCISPLTIAMVCFLDDAAALVESLKR